MAIVQLVRAQVRYHVMRFLPIVNHDQPSCCWRFAWHFASISLHSDCSTMAHNAATVNDSWMGLHSVLPWNTRVPFSIRSYAIRRIPTLSKRPPQIVIRVLAIQFRSSLNSKQNSNNAQVLVNIKLNFKTWSAKRTSLLRNWCGNPFEPLQSAFIRRV